MRNIALFVLGDKHSGHEHGMVNPKTKLREMAPMKGQPVYTSVEGRMNAIQKAIWKVGKDVRKWSGYNLRGWEKWVIDLGEVVQGVKYTDNLMTTKMQEQLKLSRESIKPFLELKGVKGARIHHATDWHDFGDGAAPDEVAYGLQQEYQDLDIKSVYKNQIDIDGFLMQFQHKGPNPGKRKRLEPNAAFWEAHDTIIRNSMEGEPIPDLVMSAHVHQPSGCQPWFVQNGEYTKCTWVTTPPMCGPGAYSRDYAYPDYYYVGMNIVQIVDGKLLDVIPFMTNLYDYTKESI